MSLDLARTLYKNATHVFIFTGAGMSVPLGTAPYWTGNGAQYGGEETAYGLTVLQHVKAHYWNQYEEEQLSYFRELYTGIDALKDKKDTHYHTLLKSLEENGKDYFNITSNIDNAFLNYGYDPERLFEVHGTTRLSQCLRFPEFHGIFPTTDPQVGTAVCPTCGGNARPNALFFDDHLFNDKLETYQYDQYLAWKKTSLEKKSLVIEIGAGTTVSTIRHLGLRVHGYYDVPFIRINPTPFPTPSDERREKNIKRSRIAPFVTLEMTADEGIAALIFNES